MVGAGAGADDLWDFSTPGGLEPLPLSETESEDDESDLKLLPPSKRRRLQHRILDVPDLVVLEDSSEEEQPDPDRELVEEAKKLRDKEDKGKHEIEFLDLTNIVPSKDSRFSARYDATQADIQKNLAKLEEVKALLNAKTPEAPEPPEPAESPLPSQQPIEDAANEGADAEPEPDLDKIIVKIQANSRNSVLKIRIGKKTELERLFNTFLKRAEDMNWLTAGTPVRFVFDGEVIRPTDTAEELDIEEDCVIEAHWQDVL